MQARAASGPRRRGRAAGEPPAPRRAGARWPSAGPSARTVRQARTASRRPCAAPPPLCPARRCRYPVSQGDTSVPDCEIVKYDDRSAATHDGGEGMGRPRRRSGRRRRRRPRTRSDLHRSAPRPRGDQPAGVRRAAARGPRRPATGFDHRHRGPQRADDRHRQADRRSRIAHSGRNAATQLRRVRHPAVSDGRSRAGHRAHHRTATRSHAARHDDRLRRQSHVHPRCIRFDRDGHRHIGG